MDQQVTLLTNKVMVEQQKIAGAIQSRATRYRLVDGIHLEPMVVNETSQTVPTEGVGSML